MKTKCYAQSFCAILVFMACHLHAQELMNSYPGSKNDITLEITLILEGAHISGDTPLMHTNLSDMGLLPTSQPFAPALPYFGNPAPVWFYPGPETLATPVEGVVDWILLELRDAPAPELAFNDRVIARRAALLLYDGSVVGTDGLPPTFDVLYQFNLYVVVYHRNHLAVMSSDQLNKSGDIYSWDFTQGKDKAYTNPEKADNPLGLKQLKDGFYGMVGGDGDGNGQIQTQDKNEVWGPQSGQSGYHAADFDLNGQVQTQDKNEIWNPNSGLASQIPGEPVGLIDIDGNFYRTVIIGNQEWMAENLKTTKYRNGASAPATWYLNDISWKDVYGALYSYGAVSSAHGLCPTGWRVPGNADWAEVLNYLADEGFPNEDIVNGAGNALKSCRQVASPLWGDCATTHHPRWDSHSTHYGTDEFGFSALPGGQRHTNGVFNDMGNIGFFWSRSGSTHYARWVFALGHDIGYLWSGLRDRNQSFSVRCVRNVD